MSAFSRSVGSPGRHPTRDKTSNCTHMQKTRLFDESGCDQCTICHRPPTFGWLYRCVQDYEGFLPAPDFYGIEDAGWFDHDAHLYVLSPAMTKAAEGGHYTDEQLSLLWKQKVEVRRTVRQLRPYSSSAASTASNSQYSISASTTCSTDESSNTDLNTDTSQLSDYPHCRRGVLEAIREVHYDLAVDPPGRTISKYVPGPACNFKVCQTCRPIYRQRAWQSLNEVLKNPCRLAPKHELKNRRISDIQVVKHLGLRCTPPHAPSTEYLGIHPPKRNTKTRFQGIIQQLLKDQEQPAREDDSQVDGSQKHDQYGQEIMHGPASLTFHRSQISADNIFADDFRPNSGNVKALHSRQGFARFTSVQAPARKVESQHAENYSSGRLSTSQGNNPCPAIVGLSIDPEKPMLKA